MRAADFENAMTPRTKMLILNTPGNPTGAVYTREELEAIVEVAAEEDIYILSDEIYEKLVYDEAKHVSVASLSKEAYDLTITVNGFSKAYAMTGWRLGYLAAPEAVAKAVDTIQSHSTSNPPPSPRMAPSRRSKATSRRSRICAKNSACGAITCMTGSRRSRTYRGKTGRRVYILVNISQLGLTSQILPIVSSAKRTWR